MGASGDECRRPARAQARSVASDPSMRVWRDYAGGTAWPTVMLAGFISSVWTLAIVLHASGILHTLAASAASFIVCYMALTPAHEAAHDNIGGKRHPWLDVVIGWVSMFMLLGPFPPFRDIHLRHHAHTNDPEKDPDMWVAVTGPKLIWRFATILLHYYWTYLFPPPTVTSNVMRFIAIGYYFAYCALIAGMVWAGFASTAVWVMIVPAWLALSFLAVVFDWLPHYPHALPGRYSNTRAIPGTVLQVFLLGQNLHLVHHLWPRVPWYSYGTVFRRTHAALRERGAMIVDSSRT